MTEPSPGTGAASAQTASWSRRVFGEFNPLRVVGGLILAILVIASAGSAVIFFAATQFQARIAELSLNGAPLTIWRVQQLGQDFSEWNKDIATRRADISTMQTGLADFKQSTTAGKAKEESEEESLTNDARSLKQRVSSVSSRVAISQLDLSHVAPPVDAAEVPPTPQAPPRIMSMTATPLTLDAAISEVELALTNDELRKRFGDEFQGLKKRYSAIVTGRAGLKTADAEIAASEIHLKDQQQQLNDRIDLAAKLFGKTNTAAAPELVERVINLTAELTSLRDLWHGLIYNISLWPNDMLVLLLLISMGVLGSALNLLAVYFTNDQDALSFGEYPLRLAFGAVLAIVMFIIAKAGIPILADTSKVGNNAPLSPYFISLLAIVSGLMSDRSMAAIRSVATSLLQSVGGADYSQRYARVDLDEALTTSSRDVNGLARSLGLDPEQTKALFSGTSSVSPSQQQLISAYFNRPIRDLFSDMKAG